MDRMYLIPLIATVKGQGKQLRGTTAVIDDALIECAKRDDHKTSENNKEVFPSFVALTFSQAANRTTVPIFVASPSTTSARTFTQHSDYVLYFF